MSPSGELVLPAAPRQVRRAFAAPAALSVIVAGLAAWTAYVLVPGNVDVSWLLVVCGRLLDGAQLHVDVVEVNPPFSIWLYMPFMLAERATGLPAELCLALGLPALALLSVGLSARILAESGVFRDVWSAWLAPIAVFVATGLSPIDFGQREQFALIALLPWLALLAARDRTSGFTAGTVGARIAAGLGAAVFVMIKPPFAVLALAAPAFYLCLTRRSLRPVLTTETLLGATVTLGYIAYLALFHLAFFVELMPLLREVYLPARKSLLDVTLLLPVALLGVMLLAAFIAARPARIDRVALLLFLAALGYVPAFLIMGKGWTYQALPFIGLGLIGLMIQIWRLRPYGGLSFVSKLAVGLGLLVAVKLAAFNWDLALGQRGAALTKARDAIASAIDRPVIASIATRLQPAHPLSRMVEGHYRSRYPGLWMVDNAQSLIASASDPAKSVRLTTIRDAHIAETALELARLQPDIILDGGSRPTIGQGAVHASPAISAFLEGYRVLYRDSVTTVLIRSDIPTVPVSAGSVADD